MNISGPVVISSKPSWQQKQSSLQQTGSEEEQDESEAGSAILSMVYSYKPSCQTPSSPIQLPFLTQDSSVVE